MTTLFVFTCVMNVRYQSMQAFVTSIGPFCNRSCKLIHLTQTSQDRRRLRALSACSQVVQLARIGVRVLVVDVVCLMLVLSARVVVQAVNTQFS